MEPNDPALRDHLRHIARTGGSAKDIVQHILRATGLTNAFGLIAVLREAFEVDLLDAKDVATWQGFGGDMDDQSFEALVDRLINASSSRWNSGKHS
jgi:hypothetical protein